MKVSKLLSGILVLVFCGFALTAMQTSSLQAYTLPDTGQTKCYDNTQEIPCPIAGQPFYGQDGNYQGAQPAYKDNGDGTVTDLNTGLVWQKQDDGTFRTWDEARIKGDEVRGTSYAEKVAWNRCRVSVHFGHGASWPCEFD